MLPDDLYSQHTGPFGVPVTTDTAFLSRYIPATAYDTIFNQLLATTFGGLTSEEIRTACITYYPERFV